MFEKPLPTSLYIHIPWCIKKCPYCDFNSHTLADIKNDYPEQRYLKALIDDIESDIQFLEHKRPIHTVFIGGGTPSLLSAEFYKALFIELKQRLDFSSCMEITLEANPGTVDEANFAGFFEAGINRLSIGVQSFNNDSLKRLGRIHNADAAMRAFKKARDSGFKNINIDIMHGLPNQKSVQAMQDLEQAIALEPEHISWYQLTIEQNTEFYKKTPVLPEEDCLADIFEQGQNFLNTNQFIQYEVSAYARENQQAKHNINYWEFGDYLGIGAGAHGKITKNDCIYRRWKTRMPEPYIEQKEKLAGMNTLKDNDRVLEFMMNALRLNDGFSETLFEERTALPFEQVSEKINALYKTQLLVFKDNKIKTTQKGRLFLNEVLGNFIY